MIDLFFYSSTALALLIGVVLNIQKNSLGFLFWMTSNLAFAAQSFLLGVYNMTILFLIQFIFSCWGLYTWR